MQRQYVFQHADQRARRYDRGHDCGYQRGISDHGSDQRRYNGDYGHARRH